MERAITDKWKFLQNQNQKGTSDILVRYIWWIMYYGGSIIKYMQKEKEKTFASWITPGKTFVYLVLCLKNWFLDRITVIFIRSFISSDSEKYMNLLLFIINLPPFAWLKNSWLFIDLVIKIAFWFAWCSIFRDKKNLTEKKLDTLWYFEKRKI